MPAEALALLGLTKRFGHTLALDKAELHVRSGTVHALVGENGAGKTTLMRVAFGLVAPDEGRIEVNGRPVTWHSPADAMAAGLGMVHQHFTNVGAMSVAENVALGGWGRYRRRAAADRVRAIGERTGLTLDPAARAETLPVGAQQRLEIVKALARNATILILDEPTAVLTPTESRELLHWIRAFTEQGNTVVLITHKLHEALAVADDVTVLRHGRTVLAQRAAEASAASLARAMLGEEGPTSRDQRVTGEPAGEPIATARGLRLLRARSDVAIRDASFDLRAGEIVGVAAVEGAGQRELLRALAGRITPDSGELSLPSSVAFVPEDRHVDGLVLDFSLAENVALRGAGRRRGVMHWSDWRSRTTQLIGEFDVRGGDAGSAARVLSGGNQQKLVLARELADRPSLIVAENPTRGLDIRATADVHDRLHDARRSGAAVVLYSSDLDEVLALATRVLVVHAGSVRELPPDRERVGRAMLGGDAA